MFAVADGSAKPLPSTHVLPRAILEDTEEDPSKVRCRSPTEGIHCCAILPDDSHEDLGTVRRINPGEITWPPAGEMSANAFAEISIEDWGDHEPGEDAVEVASEFSRFTATC